MNDGTITFFVHGIPKAQPRCRPFKRGDHASVYDPGTANDWKSLVALEAKQHRPDQPLDGPVRVDINFFFPRPKRLMRQADPEAAIPHIITPDRDNCEKAVLDVLTNLGFWRDDCQVCAGEVRKFYGPKTGITGASIWIAPIT